MGEHIVLADVSSIQKYIFGSNKLKENIGASYIIEHLFDESELIKYGPVLINVNGLQKFKAYSGGGNAVIFFDSELKADNFIKNFSTDLLINKPGITAYFSKAESSGNFAADKEILFNKIRKNKSAFSPSINLKGYGFTDNCRSSGTPMTAYNKLEVTEDCAYVSAETYEKVKASKNGKEDINSKFKDALEGFEFSDDLEDFGQKIGEENLIAIVHIDGNDVGKKFMKLKNLDETYILSEALKNAVNKAYRNLLLQITNDLKDDIKKKEYNIKKKFMPLRSIIMGGDDITFVCNGRFGLYFAKIFAESFNSTKLPDNEPLTCCAGVAIIKSKFPFYRGYQLAEELCANAKKKKRMNNSNDSWVDFHLVSGSISGNLEDVRSRGFESPQGHLLNRPYNLEDFDTLIKFTREFFKPGKEFPMNKLKEIREVLPLDLSYSNKLIAHFRSRGLQLPNFGQLKFNGSFFINGTTPFYDSVELLDIYPSFELGR